MSHASEAERFKDERLLSHRVGIVAVEGIESRVLSELARDLGQFHLEVFIAEPLFADVSALFRRMAEIGVLSLVSQSLLLKPAFLIAAFYDIPFSDALAVALSEHTGYPLLFADEGTYAILKAVALDRQSFPPAWIGDY